LYWNDWHFWAFNVADSAITVGACLLILEMAVLNRHVSTPA
jgi:signal peptidase II